MAQTIKHVYVTGCKHISMGECINSGLWTGLLEWWIEFVFSLFLDIVSYTMVHNNIIEAHT